MGTLDRYLRIILAIVFGYLYFGEVVTGTLGWLLIVLAFVFLATSFIRFCPLYLPFGLHTVKKEES